MDPLSPLAQVKSWIAGELYSEHDTFSMGKEFAQSIVTEHERLRKALERIANEDWRGNKPGSIQIAEEALNG